MRCERHAYQQFREVADARAFGRIRPAMIENELALAVTLQIERTGRRDFALRSDAHHQVTRRPSGGTRRAFRFLHRPQPVPIDEGRVVRREQRVPVLARNVADSIDDRDIGLAGLERFWIFDF